MDDSIFISIFVAFLVIGSATCQESALLDNSCLDGAGNFTKGDGFSKNLKCLLNDLFEQTPKHDGFAMESRGQTGNQTYGLALCRGDVSADFCDFCLYDARCKITQRCNKREAIIWYDYCLLKYSDYDFFGEVDTKNELLMYNFYNATDPVEFNKTARELLENLSDAAVETSSLFAGGSSFFSGENATIYGMAQCTRDLSKSNCTRCLKQAIDDLPGFTADSATVGSRTVGASCMVRFEIYTFLIDKPEAE